MLTPAFHFKVLEDFIDIFNEQSQVLVQKLTQVQAVRGQQGFNIFPFVTRCTLDIICGNLFNFIRNELASTIDPFRQKRPWVVPSTLRTRTIRNT